jgi:hypothetical protein
MKPEDIPSLEELTNTLGHYIFALDAAAQALEQYTPYSKQKWLEVLIRQGVTRFETTTLNELRPILIEGLNAVGVAVSEEVFPDEFPL